MTNGNEWRLEKWGWNCYFIINGKAIHNTAMIHVLHLSVVGRAMKRAHPLSKTAMRYW